MSFHPNDIRRRGIAANVIISGVLLLLGGGFFRTQVLQHAKYQLQSETNRLRELPLPAPRGVIYDRNGKVIADNVIGYSVSVLAQKEDTLRAVLQRLTGTINITAPQIEQAVRRFRRAPTRPTVIIPDASFDVVSVLEEHRMQFPGLIIQSSPRRFYPDGPVVAPFVGYTSEITDNELANPAYHEYKAGQQIGKQGLEKAYESVLRGKEGSQFVEVDARGRVVTSQGGARPDLVPVAAPPLYTNIDLDLQRYVAGIFGDSLQGGAVALDPKTGAVLALYSAPTPDFNRFIGGVPTAYYDSLRTDPRRPLYNKALQGQYPPGSTWKLATTVVGLETGAVTMADRMPIPCTGGMQYGNRYFRCWDKRGHGNVTLAGAIAKSCDVYFYQLGLKLGLARLIAGGVSLGMDSKAGIDLPEEKRPRFPESTEYFNRKYGRNWSQSIVLSMAIGQGDNSQTILNMAKFYTALATDGQAAKPEVARVKPEREQIVKLTAQQLDQVRGALVGVVEGGTASASAIKGVQLAGKTGTAQTGTLDPNGKELNHAWFVGFAPANDPKIVVAVMIEFGGHGTRAAAIASKIIAAYLKVTPIVDLTTDG
ncbi:MAG TPA: penicillin-binding protein 2 [Gemmatimonadaceae bacterium]|nr:penicillin-binding protein 2 [Gemmatimonadaceae bacterium]